MDSVDLRHFPKQTVKRGAVLSVSAVGGEILRDKIDFFDAVLPECNRFCNHRLDGAAAMRAAQLRNNAECAFVVAAFGDLEKGRVSRR